MKCNRLEFIEAHTLTRTTAYGITCQVEEEIEEQKKLVAAAGTETKTQEEFLGRVSEADRVEL